MGMAPTIYRYDDVGAPVITDGRDRLYQILKACLIDGYGSKAAAGWSVVYDDWSGSGVFTITNALQTGVLGLKWLDNAGYGPGMFVCEGMIDAYTPVNARSGKNALNSLDELTDVVGYQRGQFINSGSYNNWVVVANENCCLFFMGSDEVLFSPQEGTSFNNYMQFFGVGSGLSATGLADDDLGNFLIVGGNHRLSFYTSSNYGWQSDPNNNYRGTVFYENGQLKNGTGHMDAYPLACSDQSQPKENTAYMPLAPVIFRDHPIDKDIMVFAMLYSGITIVSSTGYDVHLVVQKHFGLDKTAFEDFIDIGGKSLTLCYVGGWSHFAFLSLDAADWP